MNSVSLSNSLLDKWEENGNMHKEIDFENDIEHAPITNAVTGKIDVRGFQIPSNEAAKESVHA